MFALRNSLIKMNPTYPQAHGEVALHWRERELLLVAEAMGTAPLFALRKGAVGVPSPVGFRRSQSDEPEDEVRRRAVHAARSTAATPLRQALLRPLSLDLALQVAGDRLLVARQGQLLVDHVG